MGRLIDEDDLLNLLKDEDRHGYLDVSDIKNVPTAFDKEKVIKELKILYKGYCKHCSQSNLDLGMTVAYDNAIKIVEKGGTDER